MDGGLVLWVSDSPVLVKAVVFLARPKLPGSPEMIFLNLGTGVQQVFNSSPWSPPLLPSQQSVPHGLKGCSENSHDSWREQLQDRKAPGV